MRALAHQTSFFVAGGTLRPDAACYVAREADAHLYDSLVSGHLCYVFSSRQMGKSSLMVRTAVRLRQEGVEVAIVDLTAIGHNLTPEQWYNGLVFRIGQQLELEEMLDNYWFNHRHLSPLQRWLQALRDVVLTRFVGRVVVFVDEIDAILRAPFSTDEFFAGIRELYNQRSDDPHMKRLTLCFLGVTTPSDLISDSQITPFNIGRGIEPTDFTKSEAMTLAQGFDKDPQSRTALLKRIVYWTGGHPYLTQRLCYAVASGESAANDNDVDRICQEIFLSPGAIEKEVNLAYMRDRLLRGSFDTTELLSLYARARSRKRVPADRRNPLVTALLLSGIVRSEEGYLQVRNRIYERVFNQQWIMDNIPRVEGKRGRAMFQHGIAIIRSR